MTSPPPDTPRRIGFTLPDLGVAMVLVVLIASLGIPAIFGQSDVTLEAAAKLMARELRIAQNQAAYLGREVRVRFLDGGDGYHIDESLFGPGSEHVRRYSQNAVFEGVRITDLDLGDGHVLTYDERGMASTGARIELEFAGDTRVVAIEAETGQVRIHGSTSGFVDNGF